VNIVETQNLLLFGGTLFAIGLIGFLTRRSLILMFLSLETMLSGVSVNLIAFSKLHHNYQGQVLAIMILTIAACEAAIALAFVVSLYRRKPTLDVRAWDELSETILPHEQEVESETNLPEEQFPSLTPAGLDPLVRPIPSSVDVLLHESKQHPSASSQEVTQRV
jgi:NADH-quinone oxidoreductase subunit K